MSVDNDIFFIIDFYYTAGQQINYRRLADPTSRLHRIFRSSSEDSSNVIVTYSAGFKIFTPRDLNAKTPDRMDRPYAGWSYAQTGITNFPSAHSVNQYTAEVGLIGHVSGMEKLQKWVHKETNFRSPKGWAYQIKDEAVLNLSYARTQEFIFYPDLDLISQSSIRSGTGSNKISQDFTFRALQFNPLSSSTFMNSRLSWDTKAEGKRRKKEAFIFLGAGLDYVFSDIFIEGSLFKNNASPFTAKLEPVIFRHHWGFMFSSRNISWSITVLHITKEVKKGTGHEFASLAMAVRF